MTTTKRVTHHQEHEVYTAPQGLHRTKQVHTPGISIEVEWVTGDARSTLETFQRAADEIATQIHDVTGGPQ